MKRRNQPLPHDQDPEITAGNRVLPFQTPEDYFEKLPREIERRVELLHTETARPEPDGFVAPERYFEQLESSIHARIRGGASPAFRWWKQPEWSLSIAALLVCLFLGTRNYFTDRKVDYTAAIQPLSVDEVSEALDYLDLDPSTVASLLPASEETGTNEQELKQYLLENDIDLSQLEL
ncbi:MAG: hypothetical protein U0X34_03740 [Bacteroidia bacterium]